MSIKTIGYTIALSGKIDYRYFELFESDYNFEIISSHQKGDIALTGRYKGQECKDDYLLVTSSSKNSFRELKLFLYRIKIIEIAQEIDTDFHINLEYEDQCNISFDNEILHLLNDLNLILNISCYE